MRLLFSVFIASAIGCFTAVTDSAAFTRETSNGVAVAWADSKAVLNLRLGCPSTPLEIWGPCWDDAVVDAASRWLGTNTSFRFFIGTPTVAADPCETDEFRTTAFRSTLCGGRGFGSSLAVTYFIINPATGAFVDTDTIFDSKRVWDTYDGPLQVNAAGTVVYDFHRIAIHELGHVLGLDHPDDAGQTVTAIMNRRVSDVDTTQADDLAGIRAIYPATGTGVVGTLENPPAGKTTAVSGINTISGWVCTASQITVIVDGSITIPVAYGTPRSDTRNTCGKDNNGFGLLVNWNNLSTGTHQVIAYADGAEFGRATVTVSKFATDFLRNANGTYTVPFNGRTVTLQWQESLQNFVINGIQ
jgi:hypothetical protein